MKHGSRKNTIEGKFPKRRCSEIGLICMNRGDTNFANALFCPGKHRPAQIDKMAMKRANLLKNPKSEVSGPTADIEHRIMGMQVHGGSLCHKLKDQSCVNCSLLTGFKTAESFHLTVESRAYFGRS